MLQITLPENLSALVEAQAIQHGQDVQAWIFSALENQARQQALEEKMAQALASGPPQSTDDAWWAELQAETLRQIAEQKAS